MLAAVARRRCPYRPANTHRRSPELVRFCNCRALFGSILVVSCDPAEEAGMNSAPLIRVTAMPADTNPYGGVFGGWLMSQMALARSEENTSEHQSLMRSSYD